MVQRKVINKLGIQANQVISEKGLVNLKPSSSQHPDGKNRGAHLKKKMKKSKSIKRSDFESSRPSPSLRKEIPQPRKQPPLDHVNTRATTPQRQSPVKTPEASPNYMKSTTSFEARKERSQVSTRTPQTSTVSKSLSPKKSNNLGYGSSSGHKTVGTLSRTSSLKLVRMLTKTTSFKPTRGLAKKYSPIVLCENLDVQKPTCSSTLKDSKFPSYLTLSPGATEAEGTSAMKVCPYTYCSLNGHHHAPVAPLKGFLSAKRRMMKAQKIIKLGCLSPRRAEPTGERVIVAEEPLMEEMDFNSLPISPPMQENRPDFFIEIYNKQKENTADKKILESLPGISCFSNDDFVDNLIQQSVATEMSTKLFKEKDENAEAEEEVSPFSLNQENTKIECIQGKNIRPNSQHGQSDSEASEIEWEEGNYYEPSLHDVPNLKLKGFDYCGIYDKLHRESITKSDENGSNNFEDVLENKGPEGFYDEKSVSSDAWFDDGDSESDGTYQNMICDESVFVCNDLDLHKAYATCDGSEESTITADNDKNYESDDAGGKESTWTKTLDPHEELKATSKDQTGVSKESDGVPEVDLLLEADDTNCTSDDEESFFEQQGNNSANDRCASWMLMNQDSNSFQDPTEQEKDGTYKHYNTSHSYGSTEVNHLDLVSEGGFSNEISDQNLLENTEHAEADQEDRKQETLNAETGDKMVEKQQLPDITKESETNRMVVGDSLLDGIQDHTFSKRSQHLEHETQGYTEINQDGAETYNTSSTYSEDQTLSEDARLWSTEDRDHDANKMESEHTSNSDAKETCSTARNSSSIGTKDRIPYIRRNLKEDVPHACKNPSWTIRTRKQVEELEASRSFNPREPNYLPMESEPEAEKVDLRHQTMEERKDAEEWMVDYALRQAVTKLAPARKRKVALLVEAFEKVLPTPKYETHLRQTSAAFVNARTLQACR